MLRPHAAENSTELLSQFTIFWHKKCKAQTAPKYPKISFLLHEYQAGTLVYLAHKQYRRADRNPGAEEKRKKAPDPWIKITRKSLSRTARDREPHEMQCEHEMKNGIAIAPVYGRIDGFPASAAILFLRLTEKLSRSRNAVNAVILCLLSRNTRNDKRKRNRFLSWINFRDKRPSKRTQ